MQERSNLEIVKQVYRDFAEGKIQEVLMFFDPDIIFFRPGAPLIPFSGTFTGINGLAEMFLLTSQHIRLESFIPQKFCSNDDTVAVLGTDSAVVLSTGKNYTSHWVQVFTMKDKKIVKVDVYLDTVPISTAFTK